MSNAAEDMKQASEQPLEKDETVAATRGKLVDEMFVSATKYLEGHAGLPLTRWLRLQDAWRENAPWSVFYARMINSILQYYDAQIKEAKDVETREEMEHAIAVFKSIPPPNLSLDPADRFLANARDVKIFESDFNFPELSRHYVFIQDSLQLFAQTWQELHYRCLDFMAILNMSFDTLFPLVFKSYMLKASEMIVSIFEDLERFVASLDLTPSDNVL